MRYLALSFFFLGVIVCFFNCGDIPCTRVDCGDNGVCVNDTCLCDPGYSGLRCEFNVCDDVVCQNATCNTAFGNCECIVGYEGPDCQILSRDSFLGGWITDAWICDDTFELQQIEFIPGDSLISMTFVDPIFTDSQIGTIADRDSLIVFNQTLLIGGDSIIYSGSGSLRIDTLDLELERRIGTVDTINCEGRFIRI